MKHPYLKLVVLTILASGLFLSANYSQATIINKSNSSNNTKSSLVGWWTMDGADTTINTASDKSTTGANGTRGGTVRTAGQIGQALKFNGSSDKITVADNSALDLTTNFSVSAWAWIDPASSGFVTIYGSGTQTNFWVITFNGATLDITEDAIASYDATTAVTKGAWHHVVVVKNGDSGNNVQFFTDGVANGTAAIGTVSLPTGTKTIGVNTNQSGNFFNGKLDDIRVYSRALTPLDVIVLYKMGGGKINKTDTTKPTLKTSLAGHWTFDGADTTVNTTTDKSTSVFHGTRTGTTRTAGKIGQALKFNGTSSDFVTLPATGDFNVRGNMGRASNENWSLSAWYKGTDVTSNVDYGVGLISWNSSNLYAGFVLRSGYAEYIHYNGGWQHNIKSATLVADGNWHNITYVNFSDNTGSLYIDGIAEISRASSTIENGRFYQPYHIGANFSNKYTNGTIDDVRIYGRALSSAEAAQLYTMGGGKINKSSSNNTFKNSLVGWWTMDGADVTTNTTTDKSGSGNNGTRTGTTNVITGKIGQGIKFDGSSGYINAGSGLGSFSTTDPFTVSGWVMVQGGGLKSFVSRASAAGNGWYAYYDDSGAVCTNCFLWDFNMPAGYDRIVSPDGSVVKNRWYHFVMSQDGTNALAGRRLYINGVSVGSGSRPGSAPDNFNYVGTTVQMGARGAASFADAKLDDVRVYNRALSPAEITELYRMGK